MDIHGYLDIPREGMSQEGMAVLYFDPNEDRTGPAMSLSYSMATNPKTWLFGSFALGWLGGYLAWVAIGNYQAKKMTGSLFKQNRKVPYKPMKVPASWYNFPGEKK